jgi:hypothetical protein
MIGQPQDAASRQAAGGAHQVRESAAPYLSWRGGVLALLGALILCWPMLLTTRPLVYMDTPGYFETGHKIYERAGAMLRHPAKPAGAPAAATGDRVATPEKTDTQGIKLRSIPFSLFLFVSGSTPVGLLLSCLLQGAATLWFFLALVPRLTRRALPYAAGGFLVVAAGTTLPWFVSYAMPDLLGVVIALYYALVLSRIDRLTRTQQVLVFLAMTTAVVMHYGNLPLALGLALTVLVWRGFRREIDRAAIFYCLAPVVAAAALNFAAGYVSTGDASVAPKRMPILLARSLEDGPARWYLDDACKTERYAICQLFHPMPKNITQFLWVKNGYGAASDRQVEAIRAEEIPILIATFKRYPLEQSAAIVRNAARQLVAIGTEQLLPVPRDAPPNRPGDMWPATKWVQDYPALGLFDWITPFVTAAAAAILFGRMAWGGGQRHLREAAGIVLAALLLNALIFGGFSAPVDRYQSRLAWLIPALLALEITLSRQARRR